MIQFGAEISRLTSYTEVLDRAACIKGLGVILYLRQIVDHDSLISKQMTSVFVNFRHRDDSKME